QEPEVRQKPRRMRGVERKTVKPKLSSQNLRPPRRCDNMARHESRLRSNPVRCRTLRASSCTLYTVGPQTRQDAEIHPAAQAPDQTRRREGRTCRQIQLEPGGGRRQRAARGMGFLGTWD